MSTELREPVLPRSRPGRWLVVGLLALALALRLLVVAVIADEFVPRTDAADYDRIATSLAAGDGYGPAVIPGTAGASAFRAPMYPLVLGAVYKVAGGHSVKAGLLENALIGTAFAAMVGVLGSQLFGRRTGAIALALAAVHPTMVLFGTSLQLEPTLGLLELSTLALALQHRRHPEQRAWIVGTGVTLGMAMLTREIAFLLVPPMAILLLTAVPRAARRRGVLTAAVAVGIALLVVAPWTVRNERRFDAFVPISTSGGVGFAGTYNATSEADQVYPAMWRGPWFDDALADVILEDTRRSETELDQTLRHEAVDYLRDHPGYLPEVVFWNTVRLFDLNGPGHSLFIRQFLPYPRGLTLVSVYASYLVGVLAVYGATRPAVRRAPWAVWLFPVLAWMSFAVLSGNIRYRASIEPFVLLLAAAGVAARTERPASPAG